MLLKRIARLRPKTLAALAQLASKLSFAARSCVLARLVSLAQIGEIARRLALTCLVYS